MAIWRLQVSTAQDNLTPADRILINPHFKETLGQGPQGLCDDLAAAWRTYIQAGCEVNVRAYDAEKTPPVYPSAEKTLNLGLAAAAATNRDVALCLSYYADVNRPRHRGRLYLPCSLLGITPSGAKPTLANQQKAEGLVSILSGLGGVNVDWVVWSRVDRQARTVKNYWVDDQWDSQRRRGLRPTNRLIGTTSG